MTHLSTVRKGSRFLRETKTSNLKQEEEREGGGEEVEVGEATWQKGRKAGIKRKKKAFSAKQEKINVRQVFSTVRTLKQRGLPKGLVSE